MTCWWVKYTPLDGWLLKLAEGWRLPGDPWQLKDEDSCRVDELVVGPMDGPHGTYSILLTTDTNPETKKRRGVGSHTHPAARHTVRTAWQTRS